MRALNKLPAAFVILVPLFFAWGFFIGRSPLADYQAITMYPVYALLITALWIGMCMLHRREGTHTASVLFVLFFYEIMFFAITLWGISSIALAQLLFPGAVDPVLLTQLARAFVASALGGTLVAVCAFYGAFKGGNLGRHIPLLPFRKQKWRANPPK